jgi:NAD(P)-dependent dehydrogenase (short-subunit alcohol dehydrogenase family)
MAQDNIKQLFDLTNKVAVITGGSGDLGFDIATAFAEAGADVIITSRTLKRSVEATDRLKSKFAIDSMGIQLDHCDWKQVQNAAEKATQWKGHVDILVNNAGGHSGKSAGNLFKRDVDDIVNLIHANLIGPIFCCKAFGPTMVDQGYGKIINIASIAALVARDRDIYDQNSKKQQPVDYAASKAGLLGLTRDLAGLLSPQGVLVNAISPGGFDKGDCSEDFIKDYSKITMLGHMGRMNQDLKGAALFLASAASDYVTGQNIIVDGGFSIWK